MSCQTHIFQTLSSALYRQPVSVDINSRKQTFWDHSGVEIVRKMQFGFKPGENAISVPEAVLNMGDDKIQNKADQFSS